MPGDCCGLGCACDAPYHRDQLSEIRAANEKKCAGKQLDCPDYSCPKPTDQLIAVCESGTCKARSVSAQCTSDADCVVSCFQEGDCCPQSCQCSNVYHKDVLAALEARTGVPECRCAAVKCAKPTHEIIAQCVSGECVGKRTPLE